MPWHNKASRLGTEMPVPVPPRSQPLPSSKSDNQFPRIMGLDKIEARLDIRNPFVTPVPPPQSSQPLPSPTKSLPSRPTTTPAVKDSNLKDALHNQVATFANERKFKWASPTREHTPETESSAVSGTPTSTTSLREDSQPQPQITAKKQKTSKSALPSWAKREVASSQSTPARRAGRSSSVRSGRSSRSTPGPSTQP